MLARERDRDPMRRSERSEREQSDIRGEQPGPALSGNAGSMGFRPAVR